MSAPSRVVIAFAKAESDQKAATSLAIGFTRDGAKVAQVSEVREVLALVGVAPAESDAPDLVVASLHLDGGDDGIGLVRAVRAARDPGVRVEVARPPIILVGDAERRAAALEAGASAFIAKPAYVKDIVTLAGILAMAREGLEPGWGGELGALHLYYVVRALGAARRTGVLTLIRGGRRGELRFYDGEVTSAQVGAMHGQAAFHQLLLWPEAHFDLRVEQVVRRQQIPLTPLELLQDAERFLRDFNELASGLSPSSLYEQDLVRAAECVDQIPQEVTPVLRLFDGTRSIADVIEDSPARLAETLKIVKKLIALGAIRKLSAARQHSPGDPGAALLVEDWLVGNGPSALPSAPDAPSDGRPVVVETVREEPRRRKRNDSPGSMPASAAAVGAAGVGAGEWGMGMSHSVWGTATYAPVVPSLTATGEISIVAPLATSSSDMLASSPKEVQKEGSDRSSVRTNGKTKTSGDVEADPMNKSAKKGARVAKTLKSVPVAPAQSSPAIPAKAGPPAAAPPPASRVHTPHDRFEDHEEEFFRQEEHFANAKEPPPSEDFADLDEGKPPLGFWQRLFRRLKA